MKNSEIRELSTKELVERIDEEKAILFRQKMNHAVSPLDNPLIIPKTKKTIAKLLTELRKRELEEQNS